MKIFIISALIAFSIACNAQDKNVVSENYYVYCIMDFLMGAKTGICYIRMASDKKQREIVDDKNENVNFFHVADAMTYLSKRGWEITCALGETTTGSGHFLLKKKVENDEEALQSIPLKKKKDEE